ncbi:MAG TPA: hypothetical protein VH277_12435, partial [Gemmatimonadaceae bacterium]|nr:hypothetical protein [Gemmatimonadaceae bacterium]
MYRLSWNPTALAPSAMLSPFREPASLAVLWNGTTFLRDIGIERRAALAGRRILYAHRGSAAGVAAGVQAAAAESPVAGFRVIRTAQPHGIDGPALIAVDVGLETSWCDCLRAFGGTAAQTLPSIGLDDGLALF